MSLLDDENILMDNIKESSKPINILNSYFADKNIWDRQFVENIYDNILPKLPIGFRWEIEDNSLFCICDKGKTEVKSCPIYIRFCSDFDKKYCDNPVDYEVHVYLEEVDGKASENTKKWFSIQGKILDHLKIDSEIIKYHTIKRKSYNGEKVIMYH
jgi:hypothetical protein